MSRIILSRGRKS